MLDLLLWCLSWSRWLGGFGRIDSGSVQFSGGFADLSVVLALKDRRLGNCSAETRVILWQSLDLVVGFGSPYSLSFLFGIKFFDDIENDLAVCISLETKESNGAPQLSLGNEFALRTLLSKDDSLFRIM